MYRPVALRAIVAAVLLCLCTAAIVHADAPPRAPDTAYAVRLAEGSVPGPGFTHVFGDWYVVAASSHKAARSLPYVVETEPLVWLTADDTTFTPNDLHSQQYAPARLNLPTAWARTRGADRVVVAIFDSGCDLAHEDLAGHYLGGADYVDGGTPQDGHGHGTHVTGIAAAVTNNGRGIAGAGFDTRFVCVRVLDATGGATNATIARALTEFVDAVPPGWRAVANFSLGCQSCHSQMLQDAFAYAERRGVVTVASAGNSGTSAAAEPASYPTALGVCATDSADRVPSWSNTGVNAKVCAPGVNIYSTMMRGGAAMTSPSGYGSMSGTSMAAPNVTGVAALVLSAHPDWTPAQVRQALISTGRRVGGAPAPIVDAGAAVGAAPLPMPTVIIPPTRSIPTPTATPAANDYAGQLVALINGARAQAGLGSLRRDARLDTAADFHNRWMRDTGCFAHNCPGEPDVFARMRNAAYPVISGGENIGKGYQTPQDMMTGWMNSAGHRAAILNTYWPDIGCAYLRGPSGYAWDSYWSCDFGRAGTGKADAPVLTEPLKR